MERPALNADGTAPEGRGLSRREVLGGGAAAAAALAAGKTEGAGVPGKHVHGGPGERRAALWRLLGDLPERRAPSAERRSPERREGFTLERLTLDLNGLQKVPALLLVPDNAREKAPGLLYIHWHGGDYPVGKEELLAGTRAMQGAYAPELAKRGIVTLAIDSWCFGERMPYPDDGGRGESDTFKEMLWKGRVLFGMMLFDEWQAFRWLAEHPLVDPDRIGVFGMSMGATKAWWLAALEPRVACCMDLCCLTDFDTLIEERGLGGHGIYYYVPNLLKEFSTGDINALIAPRPRLSLNGREDKLTPPRGVERVRDRVLPLYAAAGKAEDCRIELFDCAHEELPEMRRLILDWMDRHLARPTPA
ncbi:MAG: alpha/beta hydrolase [Candidatus Hydrogenedentes bacterium]|nr:alpha/beta hydrolase [Candidatus Hydrogenedentota bacterium]